MDTVILFLKLSSGFWGFKENHSLQEKLVKKSRPGSELTTLCSVWLMLDWFIYPFHNFMFFQLDWTLQRPQQGFMTLLRLCHNLPFCNKTQRQQPRGSAPPSHVETNQKQKQLICPFFLLTRRTCNNIHFYTQQNSCFNFFPHKFLSSLNTYRTEVCLILETEERQI